MNRKEREDDKTIEYLNKLNSERLDNTRRRVAHAIRVLKPFVQSTCKSAEQKGAVRTGAAHAVNLLETAAEEMRYHCEWFGYDDSVVFHIDDACDMLGRAMAETFEDDYDVESVAADVKDACVFLAKALATLVRWDDDYDVSEI